MMDNEILIARAANVTAQGCSLLVLCVFVKKTEKIPGRAIEAALERLEAGT